MAFENQIRVDQHFIRARLLEDGETVEARLFLTPELAEGGAVTDGWSVSVDDSPVAISAGEFDEDEPLVRLTIPATPGEASLTLSYSAASGAIMGGDHELVSFTDRAVGNFSALSIPVLASVVVDADGLTVTFTFSENMTGNAAAGFSITVSGSPVALTGGVVEGDTVTFTAASTIYNTDTVLSSYDAGTGNMNASGVDLRDFTGEAVTNGSAVDPAPLFVSATILADGVSLEVEFDRALVSGSATLGFSRSVGTIDSGSYAGDTLTHLIPMVLAGADAGTLSYDAGTGTLAGAGAEAASFGPVAITNNSARAGTWSSAGQSSVSYTAPSITAINSTDIVFADRDNDALRLYRWGGSSWSLIGTPLSVAMLNPGVIALDSTDFAWIDSSANELRTYRWNGTTFAQIGSSLTGLSLLAGPQGLARLSATRIAHVNGNGDALRAYDWNGSSWSAVGSSFAVGAAGAVSITALNSTDIVFVDSANDALRLYRFNGSTWSQVGSGFTIANIAAPVVEAINGTDVAFYDTNIDRLRTYRWGGSAFAQIGSDLIVTSNGGRPWMTNMGGNKAAFVDDNLDVIRLYQWN